MPMLVEKYTSKWVANFVNIKCEIENVLIGIEYKIEHIGSTSVSNLDAKPIIDIDIIYFNKSDFEIIKTEITKIGCYYNGNQGIENK